MWTFHQRRYANGQEAHEKMLGIFIIIVVIKKIYLSVVGFSFGLMDSYFPDQGLNPGPLHWEHGTLATEP